MRYIKLLYYLVYLAVGFGLIFHYSINQGNVTWTVLFSLATLAVVFYLWRAIKKDFLRQSDADQ